MANEGDGWLFRHHPVSYASLAILFALPALVGLLVTWPDVAGLPSVYPGHWGTVALFSTLVSAGMGLRSITPSANLAERPNDLDE